MRTGIRQRPATVTIIGWLFVLFGSVGSAAVLLDLANRPGAVEPVSNKLLVLAIRAVAVLGGALLLRGRKRGRWLLLSWMVYHVVVGALNGPAQFLIHAAFLAGLWYLLFRPGVSAWFDGMGRS